MNLNDNQLIQIIEKSSTFRQRLNGKLQDGNGHLSESVKEKKLQNWHKVITNNGATSFEKRFTWDNLNLQSAEKSLSAIKLKSGVPLPQWSHLLKDAIKKAQAVNVSSLTQEAYPFLSQTNPLPFEEIVAPFILVAQEKLNLHQSSNQLSENAFNMLSYQLSRQLCHLSERALYLEFSIFRSQKRHHGFIPSNMSANKELYGSFVETMLHQRFTTFFEEYNVLARLITTTMQNWISNTSEMLTRLNNDWPNIVHMFEFSEETPLIDKIQTNLSDPHNNGRCVIMLTFASGKKLIYKPKDLGMELAFSNLIQWVNQQDVSLMLKPLIVMNQDGYGWVEFIKSTSCPDTAAIERYFQRIGMLLCLIYLLEGTDCHSENLIASGEHPVLIDAETLLHPRPIMAGSEETINGAQNLAGQQYFDSVLRTGLLPVWLFGKNGKSFDISGIGSMAGQEFQVQQLSWENVNTDDMQVRRKTEYSKQGPSMASFDGKSISAEHYLEQIVQGFVEVYGLLLGRSSDFLSQLEQFNNKCSRFVFRNTVNYFMLLEKLLQPEYLRDGIDRSIQLDVLYRAAISAKSKPNFWPLIQKEIAQMERLDIPYFTSMTNSTAIFNGSEALLEDYFSQPSFEIIQERVANLSKNNMELQVGFIRASFQLRYDINKTKFETQRPLPTQISNDNLVSISDIQESILDIAKAINKHAIIASNGTVSWMGLEYMAEADRSTIQPLGHNLHSGKCGIALFLAAFDQVTKQDTHRHVALGAINELRSTLNRQDNLASQMLTNRMSLGGAIGLGSIIYSLTRIGTFLNDDAVINDALRVAKNLPSERIEADTKYDVMDGSAGALLGLLALFEETENLTILEKARLCGDHLLNGRITTKYGERSWITANGYPLTGFSHGASGIAYALMRLYKASGEEKYKEASLEAIAYENHLFSKEEQNWLDLLSSTKEQPRYGRTWCHGAPGIGLSRLGCLPHADSPALRQDIESAMQSTITMFSNGLDTLCCGNLGRADLFITAQTKLHKPELANQTLKLITPLIKQKQNLGSFQMPYNLGNLSHTFQQGFFHGLSGIGYQLLRVIEPELPSVLLWE